MFNWRNLILGCFFLATCVQNTQSIKCYECNLPTRCYKGESPLLQDHTKKHDPYNWCCVIEVWFTPKDGPNKGKPQLTEQRKYDVTRPTEEEQKEQMMIGGCDLDRKDVTEEGVTITSECCCTEEGCNNDLRALQDRSGQKFEEGGVPREASRAGLPLMSFLILIFTAFLSIFII